MNYQTPESKGISSEKIRQYLEVLEKKNLATHSIILARGDSILFEAYWEPFHKDFLHRMYSVSKSFVSLAIGFLLQDGMIQLDDPIGKYFAKEMEGQKDPNMRSQTIRDMLMMCTAKPGRAWFADRPSDRVKNYFENDDPQSRPPGTIFSYDSSGSFVLGALVERLTGLKLMDYLRVKFMDRIGVSKEAYCLTCPGGHSWGDSGILCKPTDLLKVARFVMNGGNWEGEQILDRTYVEEATKKQVDNDLWDANECTTQGYGYQFWRTFEDSYFFNGMGCQLAVCVPHKDMILVYNGDNQGNGVAEKVILDHFFEMLVDTAEEEPLKDTGEDWRRLMEYAGGLRLVRAPGAKNSPCRDRIDRATYRMDKGDPFRWMRLSFDGDEGCLEYENQQGVKRLPFGMGHNVFGPFPQEGYSGDVGSVSEEGNYYQCAASAAWVETGKLHIKVQIIDRYMGILNMFIHFKGTDTVGVYMVKSAEDFLEEYQGFATGHRE